MLKLDIAGNFGLYDARTEHAACGVGFLVDIKGARSHALLRDSIKILENLEHRGACGCEKNTGDGAGILFQLPHGFFQQESEKLGISLPEPGAYGVGMTFLPTDPAQRQECEWLFEQIVRRNGQEVLGWRPVPIDDSNIGPSAKATEPVIRQILIGRSHELSDGMSFERKLYAIRRQIEKAVATLELPQRNMFYVCSLSHRTIVYKGMLKAGQVTRFYPDLDDSSVTTALALVHSRFSTNTFPSWARAHPYRFICHNGEINTLRGNINWMRARQTLFESELFGSDLEKILPVIEESGSDSAMFDNVLELLSLAGRSLPHAMMMMIPEPWEKHESMSAEKKAFYEFHSCLMEPWDGPASVTFTDGQMVGAVLDRNGLRPSRYYLTEDDRVVMASEVGVLDIPPDQIRFKGRVQPGQMLLIDTREGRIVPDRELKQTIATRHPYAEWLKHHLIALRDLPDPVHVHPPDHETVRLRQQVFGYSTEDLRMIMAPMGQSGTEPIGSMGYDVPLAVLSERPQLLYNYFKQLFAQVTNPPIDSIREELIMSIETSIGPERNLLDPEPSSARQIRLTSPILTNEELEKLRQLDGSNPDELPGHPGFRTITLPIFFPVKEAGPGLEQALERVCQEASNAIREGHELIILSDRGRTDRQTAPIPALLAVAGVHHHLIREGTRTHIGLILESGEPREIHHFCLLIGYGASAINPYLAFESLDDMIRQQVLEGLDHFEAIKRYRKAVNKGILKVMAKMGISTIQSYHGAQIFEAVGLNQELIDKYFTWTSSRIAGIGIEEIAEEVRCRHRRAFPDRPLEGQCLDEGGYLQWRHDGEHHLFSPQAVHKLQNACRTGSFEEFKQYTALIDNQARKLATLRGLFQLERAGDPVSLDEVEPVESILRRFKTGAMSYGSISQEAHESLAIAMNRIGGQSNSGEGGEDPDRYKVDPDGTSRNSAIKQVASGRFGVTSEYLTQAREIQIKMAQGAKPGEGGQLPGHKVYPWIAQVRHSTPGVGLISPPPHHDIYSIEDLAQLIHDLKNANQDARISVKLVSEVGVGTIAAGVSKAHADVVLISGHDGGTGASPLTSLKHAGIPWELGLAETHQVLLMNDLRSRIAVEVDGQLKTGRDVVIGALLGAEEFGFATAPLVVLGCVMMRVCHLNTCPVGVATQDPELRAKFTGTPDHVVNFMRFIAQEVREWMARLGFRTLEEMVGHSECLQVDEAIAHWKARGLDFSRILHQPKLPSYVGKFCQIQQEHELDKSLDRTQLLDLCEPALENGNRVTATLPIRNTNRAVGTILGSRVTRRHGANGLADDTIQLHFKGSAGQSFGAFIPPGITLRLEGDSNDYLGKGLSGGRIIVHPSEGSRFAPEENTIIGNVAFYGATAGEAYIAGLAGERFCVRNSGVHAVVEGVGDHGCEYMTGGRVVILGPTGRNFAAGMSGGLAYLLNPPDDFDSLCNREMVELHALRDPSERELVRGMILRHARYTGSRVAWKLLSTWEEGVDRSIKIYPVDYKRVVESQDALIKGGLSPEEASMQAFEQNAMGKNRAEGN